MNKKMLFKKNALIAAARGRGFSEFKTIFKAQVRKLIEDHPKLTCSMMLLAIAASAVHLAISNQITRHQQTALVPEKATIYVPPGFGQLLVTGSSIKEIWNMQTQLEGLLLKDSLGQEDSVLLRRVQHRLQITDHLHQLKP